MFTEKYFAIACENRADMARPMRLQCRISNILFSNMATQWINISKTFCTSLLMVVVGRPWRCYSTKWPILGKGWSKWNTVAP